MKRLSAIVLCAVLSAALLCGCGKNGKDDAMSDVNSTVSNVKSDIESMITPDSSTQSNIDSSR